MSNYDIQSKISQIQSEISQVRSEIYKIQSELNYIGNACTSSISTLNMTSNKINTTFANNSNALKYADGRLNSVINTQIQIKELLFIFEDVQTANKKIRALNNKLFFEFNNHSKVRKIVRGFLDNLDLDLVNDENIYKAVEKEHLQTPDFWLTYVLIAIMTWKNNDKKRCERAIEGALKLNEKATMLFLMLFNLRLRRFDAALKWFESYKSTEMVGKDDATFLMLISSIPFKINELEQSDDKVTKEFLAFIKERIANDIDVSDTDSYANLVKVYFEKMDHSETLKYDNLRRYVTDYQAMANAYSLAKNNADILEYVEELSHVIKREANVFLDEYIERLIAEPSSGEEEILKEIAYNEEIIDALKDVKSAEDLVNCSAFKEMAKERFEAKVEHDESELNLCDELMKWSFIKREKNVNTLTNWNIFVLNGDHVKEGYDLYLNNYRNMNKSTHTVAIEDFSYRTNFTNINNDLQVKNDFIKTKEANLISKVKNTAVIVYAILAVLAVALGIYLMVGTETGLQILGFIGAGVFAIASVATLISNKLKIARIKKKMANDSERFGNIIKKLFEEKTSFDVAYKEADDVANDILGFFASNL